MNVERVELDAHVAKFAWILLAHTAASIQNVLVEERVEMDDVSVSKAKLPSMETFSNSVWPKERECIIRAELHAHIFVTGSQHTKTTLPSWKLPISTMPFL